ncbi:MAG: SagB/ThcOx family dehydrogenase [Gemmatimonadota bacterium]
MKTHPHRSSFPGLSDSPGLHLTALALTLCGTVLATSTCNAQSAMSRNDAIPLPEVTRDGSLSVERAIFQRRSIRSFAEEAVSMEAVGQILWACQGVTEPRDEAPQGFSWEWMGGLRAAPSAGALYPLEVYVVAASVRGLEAGVYRYLPTEHALELHREGDHREALWDAALRQTFILQAPFTLVMAAVMERTAAKYGDRAERYVHMEVGAAGENVYLQAGSLELGTVFVGAFRDEEVGRVLGLPSGQRAFGIMPVGRPSRE